MLIYFLSKIQYLFQHFFRSFTESIGYTPPGNEIEDISGSLIVKVDIGGLFPIYINHLKAFKYGFKKIPQVDLSIKSDKIYLTFNLNNKLTKIGFSKTPKFREKTLQGEDPNTEIIAIWESDRKNEKMLHNKFSHKRKRGEWFNLTFKDLQEIKLILTLS